VSYGALAIARLGLRVAALVGADAQATKAEELETLRESGVDVRVAALASGPVFENIEGPGGRRQVAYEAADPLPVGTLPPEWRSAPAWLLGPVAGELPEAWADVPPEDALVAVGWQGLLRDVRAGEPVRHLAPGPSALLHRADIVAVSGTDFGPDIRIDEVCAWVATGRHAAGDERRPGRPGGGGRPGWSASAVPVPFAAARCRGGSDGAGDVFLAAFLAARARPDLVGGRIAQRYDLLLAAAASSLLVEGPGLAGVPAREAVRQRMAEAAARI
jgi:hypothetical protein